jgi:hypothetical protein
LAEREGMYNIPLIPLQRGKDEYRAVGIKGMPKSSPFLKGD